MLKQETIADQILEVVRLNPECSLEEVTDHFPEARWWDVFYEVHKLRESGQLRLTQSSLGVTTLQCVHGDATGRLE